MSLGADRARKRDVVALAVRIALFRCERGTAEIVRAWTVRTLHLVEKSTDRMRPVGAREWVNSLIEPLVNSTVK